MLFRLMAWGVMVVLLMAGSAIGRPNFGRNCSNCHSGGSLGQEMIQVTGFDDLADPDESSTGATDRGILKAFTVLPGQEVELSVAVDLGTLFNYAYAVELKRTEVAGVENGGTLGFTADLDWFRQTGQVEMDATRPYYTNTAEHGVFYDQPATYTFTMLIDPDTPADFYDLEFAVAGQPESFYDDEHFYLHVVPEPASLMLMGFGLVYLSRWRVGLTANAG